MSADWHDWHGSVAKATLLFFDALAKTFAVDRRLVPPVDIVQPHDIVLTKIAAGLNLD
jgi:hypothetical protein